MEFGMGITDKAAELLNKGVATAGRVSRQQTIKAEIKELDNQQEKLFTVLGKKIYNLHWDNPNIKTPFEPIFESLESLELQKQALQIDLKAMSITPEEIDNQQQFCSSCGKPTSVNQSFCIFCGSKTEKQLPAPLLKCKQCGSALVEGQKYCIQCGEPFS